jgi:hypothetical protein
MEELDTTRLVTKHTVFTICDGHVVDTRPARKHQRRADDMMDAIEYSYGDATYVVLTDDGEKFDAAKFQQTTVAVEDVMIAECDVPDVLFASLKIVYDGNESYLDVTRYVKQICGPLRDFHLPTFNTRHVLEYLAVCACHEQDIDYDDTLFAKTLTIEYDGSPRTVCAFSQTSDNAVLLSHFAKY